MTELSKEIFDKYQARRSEEHKTEFIRFLEKSILPYGLSFDAKPMGLFGSRNIVVGDIENAKIIFTAHYDTCSILPYSIRIYPGAITPMIIVFLILFACVVIFGNFILETVFTLITPESGIVLGKAIMMISGLAFLLLLLMGALSCYNMFWGKESVNTANDNTSGVITLCEILADADKEQLKKIAFIFFDNEEKWLVGSLAFRNKYKRAIKNKLIINFDSVSDGDNIVIVKNKKVKKLYGDIIDQAFNERTKKKVMIKSAASFHFPSDQMWFPQNIAIAAFKKSWFGNLYLDKIHTNKDTEFDESNIDFIKNESLKLIDNI